VVCEGCSESFECDQVLEVGVVEGAGDGDRRGPAEARRRRLRVPRRRDPRLPGSPAPGWLKDPESHAWRYLSIPIAAGVVIGALVLIQGSDEPTRHSASSAASAAHEPSRKGGAADATGGGGAAASAHENARVIKGSSFTLALPAGWARSEPSGGATFSAATRDGRADATLWIRRDPKLTFPAFETQSLAQLRSLAGSAHVVDRVAAPTPERAEVTLAADSPPGQPTYEVTLRTSGPYRYYLATTVEPNAPSGAVDGAELIHNSFLPVAAGETGQ